MTMRNSIFDVGADISLFQQSMAVKQQPTKKQGRHLEYVMEILSQQMKVSGFKERTITDYNG